MEQFPCNQKVEKAEEAIMYGQSRDTGNVGTRYRVKTYKTKPTTHSTKKINNTNPTKNP
jgi:hypothetical protein